MTLESSTELLALEALLLSILESFEQYKEHRSIINIFCNYSVIVLNLNQWN